MVKFTHLAKGKMFLIDLLTSLIIIDSPGIRKTAAIKLLFSLMSMVFKEISIKLWGNLMPA